MLFAGICLLVAGVGFMLAHVVLNRSKSPRLGLAYLRTSLALTFFLVAIDVLAVVVFGVWWVPIPLAIGMGFVLPGAMLAMT